MHSQTTTIIQALKILSEDIQTQDGVISACLLEASERLQHFYNFVEEIQRDTTFNSIIHIGEQRKKNMEFLLR